MKKLFVLFLLVFLNGQQVKAQIDTLFWFAAPWVTPDHDGNTQLAFRISTFNNPASVRIQLPAGTYDTTFAVPANSLASIPLNHIVNDLESKPANAILNSGIKITSDELITVVYDFISDLITITPGTPNNPETYSLKGQNGMGTEFVTPFQTLWNNRDLTTDRNGDGVVTDPRQFFSVVATEDNTTVWIKPNCDVVGHAADVTYSIFLPVAGNVYTCENVTMLTSVPGSSLSGSIVYSDKPVSVTVNDDSVNPAGGGGCFDLMGDQIVPTDVIGNDYIINKGFLNTGSNESIFIIPAENFTTITVNDGATTTQLLNQGETWQYSITQNLTSVIADKPVYVVHMSGYGCELGFAILPPLNCAGSDEVSLSRNNAQQFLLNILCEAGDEGSFAITPPTATIPAGSFNPVPGMPGWVGAQIDYPTANIVPGNQYTITNSAGFFSLGVINGGATTGCLYHYMSSFHRKVYTDAGPDYNLCSGEPLVNLNGSVTGGTITGVWSVLNGTGTLNNPSSLATTYLPSPSDYTQGSVTFVLASTGNCEPITDTVTVSFINSPEVNAGADISYCKNNVTAVPLNGTLIFAAGASWTGGNGGAFGNPGSLNTSYTPSPADIANDSVVLYLTSSGSFYACPDDEDTIVIYFTEPPTVNAGADLVICSNQNAININGSVTGATTTGNWSTSGTGAFSPTSSNLSTNYQVSSIDTTVGSLYLTLTSTNNGSCLAEKDSILVTFLDPPSITITSSDSICSSLTYFDLNGIMSSGYTPTWSSSGFGSILSPNSINTQYTISPVDTTLGYVDVFLASNAGICPVQEDSIRVYFIDPPNVYAGPDQLVCDNEQVVLNGSIGGIFNSGNWSTMGTGNFYFDPGLLQTVYVPSSNDLSNGTVNIILTSDSLFGCPPESDLMSVSFIPTPSVDFTSTTVCEGDNTVFNDQSTISSGSITSWNWNFGDQGTSITQNPIHTYAGDGIYNVTLIASGSNGCSDTLTQQVTVNPVPIAVFTPTNGCENMPITFNDLSFISSGTITNWLYDFGTTTSTEQNPTYTYSSPGSQLVTLTVTSNLGCSDDSSVLFTVYPAPNADFTYTPNPAMVQENVLLLDQSTGNNIYQWYWEFGDGEGSNAQNPNHEYEDGGEYTIFLIVTDQNGCIDTVSQQIIIALPPVLPTGFSPNGDNENDVFIIRGGPFNAVDFKVYNNWGEVVFATTDPSVGWDGYFKGQEAPLGVYTWTFVVTLANDTVIKKSGDVTLIR